MNLKSSHNPVKKSYDPQFSYLCIKQANRFRQQNVDKSATKYVFQLQQKIKKTRNFSFA